MALTPRPLSVPFPAEVISSLQTISSWKKPDSRVFQIHIFLCFSRESYLTVDINTSAAAYRKLHCVTFQLAAFYASLVFLNHYSSA